MWKNKKCANSAKLYIFEKHLTQKIQKCKNVKKCDPPPPSVRIGLSAKLIANVNQKTSLDDKWQIDNFLL